MRIPNIVSELSLDNIWSICWPKNRQNRPELWFPLFVDVFSAKIRVKYNQKPILRPYLESPHQGESFRWKRGYGSEIDFFFLLPLVFSKFYLLCANRKSYFCGKSYPMLLPISNSTRLAPKNGKCYLCCKMARPSAHMRAPFSYFGNGWMDRAEIWFVIGDSLAWRFTKVNGGGGGPGALAYVRTYFP